VSGSTPSPSAAATPVPQSATAAAQASAAAKASAAAQASAAKASASASASASQASAKAATQRTAAQSVTTLPVASVRAFGPDGFADGDDPGSASAAIARAAAAPWATQWYDTPRFGLLKHGTGLLLTLGHKVTVTSVRLDLSQYGGATVQLRAGNGAALSDLPVAATASNASGVLRLTLHHPVTAKYLLIWITVLPPDGAGHYQESVSHVVVSGHR
jgi:eukaryotic-like serine/threonine-protein kinase